ncbi:MAG TPA: hypothetical protein VF077_12715 [Nitrospiraceae bacterium]
MAHRHAVYLCACGAVRTQCRCLDDAKPRLVVSQTCAVCQGQDHPGMRTFVWDDWAPPQLRREDVPAVMYGGGHAIVGPPRVPGLCQADYADAPAWPPRRVLRQLGPVVLPSTRSNCL